MANTKKNSKKKQKQTKQTAIRQNPASSKSTTNSDKDHYDGISNSFLQNLLPNSADPYIRLLRLDRPIGTWLLLWPAFWGLAAAYRSDPVNLIINPGLATGDAAPQLTQQPLIIFALFLLGAFLTRSAGCVINDIADRNIDKAVARTRARPLASGTISVKTAAIILLCLLLLALLILLQFNELTIWLGVFIVLPILIYPLMKRITYWPQAMLSLCFCWGGLMAWTAVKNEISLPAILMTIAAYSWTMGYDTIYAHQDKEDDAIIGMKSTALKFGDNTKIWLSCFYGLTIILLYAVGLLIDAKLIYFTSVGMAALHASWQISTLKLDDPANCLHRFRANGLFGLIIFVGLAADLNLALLLLN